MTYDVIALACEQLSYRDKLLLAQLLIQTARKDEENSNPQNRSESNAIKTKRSNEEPLKQATPIEYFVERRKHIKTEQNCVRYL